MQVILLVRVLLCVLAFFRLELPFCYFHRHFQFTTHVGVAAGYVLACADFGFAW